MKARQRQQAEIQFTLKDLSGQDIDTIMGALLERPMKEVVQVFGKLQAQIKEQIQAANAPAAEAPDKSASAANGKVPTGKSK